MKNICGICFLAFILISSKVFANQVSKTIISGMDACEKSSNIQRFVYSDNNSRPYDMYWSNHAGEKCPGPKFPRVVVDHPTVKYYIHVIKVNQPRSFFRSEFHGWMYDLGIDPEKEWVFLDVGEKLRTLKIPFYNGSGNRFFHDNPMWGVFQPKNRKEVRKWRGYLYGFEGKQLKKPVLQIKWGFDQLPYSIKPSSTNDKMLKLFLEKYKD